MNKAILIHNPRCSKSREVENLLEEKNIQFEVVDYLKDGLKEKMLSNLPMLLGIKFEEMIRTKEEIYKELKLEDKLMTDKKWIAILKVNPILLERPIFIYKGQAVIARPTDRVNEIL